MNHKEKPIFLCWMKPMRNWRFRSQIILFFLTTSITLLLVSFLFTYVQKITIQTILKDSASTSFNITTNFSLQRNQNQFEILLNHRWNYLTSDLLQRQKLYLLVEQQQFTGFSKMKIHPYNAVPKTKFLKSFNDQFHYSMECYSSYGDGIKNFSQVEPFNAQVIQKIQEVYPLIFSNHKIFKTRTTTISFDQNEQTLSHYPCQKLNVKNFKPKDRIWYKNMLQQYQLNYNKYHQPDAFNEHFNISKPFLNYAFTQIQLAFTMSLLNSQNDFKGVLSASMFYGDYQNVYDQFDSTTNVFLVSEDAELIMSNLLQSQQTEQILYVYNQSLTGFNYDDWTEIQNIFNESTDLKSDCKTQGFFLKERILCRVNKTNGQDTFIMAKKAQIINGIIISFYNAMDVLKQNENEQIYMAQTIDQQTNVNIFICFSTLIFVVITVTLIIAWILRPLEKIITFSKCHVQRQNPQQFKSFSNRVKFMDLKKNEGPFQKLFTSIYNLTYGSKINKELIQKLNAKQYPRNYCKLKLQISSQLRKIQVILLIQFKIKEFQFQTNIIYPNIVIENFHNKSKINYLTKLQRIRIFEENQETVLSFQYSNYEEIVAR